MSSNIRIQRICRHCGDEFTAKTTVTQTCSPKCRKADYKTRKRNEKIEQSNRETIRIKSEPVAEIAGKQFLTVPELALLMNCSKRTAYRLVNKGILPGVANLSERLTRIKRSEVDKLFEQFDQEQPHPVQFTITDGYSLKEIQTKYTISDKALYDLIKRFNVPKLNERGRVYVPKTIIDKLLKNDNMRSQIVTASNDNKMNDSK